MTWWEKDEEGEKERMGREEERGIKPHCKVVLPSGEATSRVTLKNLCFLSDGFCFIDWGYLRAKNQLDRFQISQKNFQSSIFSCAGFLVFVKDNPVFVCSDRCG